MKLKEVKVLAKRAGIDYARISRLENTDQYMITHAPDQCAGEQCCIHNRTDHAMRSFPQQFRWDRGIMERICPEHGVGHPDPDQAAFFEKLAGEEAWAEWVHGCCGCGHEGQESALVNYDSDIIEE